jgi:hypothetical protein
MVITNNAPKSQVLSSTTSEFQQSKHLKVIEKTFNNNAESDYTEKIRDLGNEFNYASNSDYFWSIPELSLLYGTPLYNAASEKQKLALNHLYWAANYNHTAVSEATTSIYNSVTNGVFRAYGGYETLCKELDFETEQESYHIRTFQKICFKTKMGIVGKTILGNSNYSTQENNGLFGFLSSKSLQELFSSHPFSTYRDNTLKAIAKTMLSEKKSYYSEYLRDLEEKGKEIPAPTDGLGGRIAPTYLLRFFTLHWGMSPFMACQYYSLRYTANVILKNQEYLYVKRFRELEQKGEYIPAPTAVSYYHLLDEAFHTTISQTIAKDMYRDLPKPTSYEKMISGIIVYMMQQNLLSGISAVIPGRCVHDDPAIMVFFYKLLKSPLFGMETEEALDWMEKCFCHEHEGFHVAIKYHQSLLEYMRRLFGTLDYQWKINREMGIMAKGSSIDKAIKANTKSFNEFSKLIMVNG